MIFSVFGPARSFAVTNAAQARNSSALRTGTYFFRVVGAAVHVRSGRSTVTAISTDEYMADGDGFFFTVGGETLHEYVSVIGDTPTSATIYVCGVDVLTGQEQPPAWA